MWSNPDAKCVPSNPEQGTNLYRYPIGFTPGNVVPNPSASEKWFKTGTFAYRLFYVIVPAIAGLLMFLFFLCTTIYLLYTMLRLFYLDRLKPYKAKTLRKLGKDRHYDKYGPSGSTVRVRQFKGDSPSQSTIKVKKSASFLVHPPGQKLSFTSPPSHMKPGDKGKPGILLGEDGTRERHSQSTPGRKSQASGPDKGLHVKDLLSGEFRQVEQFPRENPSMFIAGRKPVYPSRIPVMTNRTGGPWIWNPNWYKKQIAEERDAGEALVRLQSTMSNLHVAISSRNVSPDASPKPTPPPMADDAGEDKINLKPQDTSVSPSRPFPFHTQIPKSTKKNYNQQFMILRAAPRKNSVAIEEMRKKRRSSEAGADIQDLKNVGK